MLKGKSIAAAKDVDDLVEDDQPIEKLQVGARDFLNTKKVGQQLIEEAERGKNTGEHKLLKGQSHGGQQSVTVIEEIKGNLVLDNTGQKDSNKDITEGDNVHVKAKENTNVITNQLEDASGVVRNLKITPCATFDPNTPVVTNIVKASEATHEQHQLVLLQSKEVASITTDVVVGVLNPAAPGNSNAISVTTLKSKGTRGDELMLVNGQDKPTHDVPASIALAGIYNTVNPVVQARHMRDSQHKAGQTHTTT